MPTQTPKEDCNHKKTPDEWRELGRQRHSSGSDVLWDRDRPRPSLSYPRRSDDCHVWPHQVRSKYDSPRRVLRFLAWNLRRSETSETLEQMFHQHAERWKEDTQHMSSVTKM